MPTFHFPTLHPFAGTSTTIRRPREFAYFSFDHDHVLHPLDQSSLTYYYPPFFHTPGVPVPDVDLSRGFDEFRQRDDSVDEHLDALLETLQRYEEGRLAEVRAKAEAEASRGGTGEEGEEEKEKEEDVRVKADIVTWRGMMTKVCDGNLHDQRGRWMDVPGRKR